MGNRECSKRGMSCIHEYWVDVHSLPYRLNQLCGITCLFVAIENGLRAFLLSKYIL